MRITSQTLNRQIQEELQRLGRDQNRLTSQVATGRRVQSLSDDAISAGRLMDYNSRKRVLQQVDDNASFAAQAADLSALHLGKLKELASDAFNLAAGSTGKGLSERTLLADQIDAILEMGLSLVGAKHNGNNIFGGSEFSAEPFSETRDANGRILSVAYQGSAGAAPQIQVGERTTVSPLNHGSENQQLADFLNSLAGLRDAVQNADEPLTRSLQGQVGDHEDQIFLMQANSSAVEFQITVAREQNAARYQELVELHSAESGIDLAGTMLQLKQTETAYQAALQVAARLNQTSLLDFI